MTKRLFDIVFSVVALLATGWLIIVLWLTLTLLSGQNGFFSQQRVGRYAQLFNIYKLRTIYTKRNKAVLLIANFLRKSKLDELPQLWNVLKGDMSVVGPRPDVPGYYDRLEGEARKILELRPGITGPASMKYANEDRLLALQEDSLLYNDEVIFPDKIRINLEYYRNRTLWLDVKIIIKTLLGSK